MKLKLFVSAFAVSALCGLNTTAFSHGGGAGGVETTDTLDPGSVSVAIDWTFTKFETFRNQRIAAAAQHGTFLESLDDEWVYTGRVAFGVIENLEFGVSQTWMHQSDIKEGEFEEDEGEGEADMEGHSSGTGDITLDAKYRVVNKDSFAFSVFTSLRLPTADNDQKNRRHIRLEPAHQPGWGSLDFMYGMAFSVKSENGGTLGGSFAHTVTGEGSQNSEEGDSYVTGLSYDRHLFGAFHGRAELVHTKRNRDNVRGTINPNTGSEQVHVVPTLTFEGIPNTEIYVTFPIEVFEHLHGEQRGENWSVSTGVVIEF